ncbi:MAG: hypothetical protein OSA23_03970 [Rhodospirillales bacterium]|nr:hypothetical protein [Rhodospirillales bacterium]
MTIAPGTTDIELMVSAGHSVVNDMKKNDGNHLKRSFYVDPEITTSKVL